LGISFIEPGINREKGDISILIILVLAERGIT
jgi:hypothetical protein